MRLISVNVDYVKAHLGDLDIFRLMLCDDSKDTSNKPHYAMRVRPLSTLPIDEFTESCNNPMCVFVKVELDV